MRSRHSARRLAVQTLYALDFNSLLSEKLYPYSDSFPCIDEDELKDLDSSDIIYAYYLINGVLQNLKLIDEILVNNSSRRISRISIVDRNILRISIFMFKFEKGILNPIVIDEAVKLSQELSNEINFRFINGVLDTICRKCHD